MVRIAIAAAVIAAASGAASAAHTVELKKIDTGLGSSVKIIHGGDSFNAFAGEIIHEFRNGVGLGEQFNGRTMATYCTEVTESVTTSFRTYTVTNDVATLNTPTLGTAKAAALNSMFAMLLGKQGEGVFNNDWATAFQIAVWDVIYDYDADVGRSSLSVTTGNLKVKKTNGDPLGSSIRTKAEAFWDAIGVSTSAFNVMGFHHDGKQDQIVPTPGSILLGALGVIVAAPRRRNR